MSKSEKPFSKVKYLIYEGKFWNVILMDDQSYLGRSIVYLKSRYIEDPLQLTKEEWEECWFEIMPRLASALKKAFRVDRINYCHLANFTHHVHWHIVPRYEKNPVREFAGETFRDEKVGKHYAGTPNKNFSSGVMNKICKEIKKNFK